MVLMVMDVILVWNMKLWLYQEFICEKREYSLIFHEVMSGFRVLMFWKFWCIGGAYLSLTLVPRWLIESSMSHQVISDNVLMLFWVLSLNKLLRLWRRAFKLKFNSEWWSECYTTHAAWRSIDLNIRRRVMSHSLCNSDLWRLYLGFKLVWMIYW